MTSMDNDTTFMLKGEATTGTQFDRFGREQWNKIEKYYEDALTKTVLKLMCDLGAEGVFHKDTMQKNLKFMNDESYLMIRDTLVSEKLVPAITIEKIKPVKDAKKKNKKANPNKLSKDEIIKKNTMEMINKNLNETLATFIKDRFNGSFGFRSPYAEIRMITLIYGVNYLLNSQKKFSMAQCYELILGIKKIINNFATFSDISKMALNDLKYAYEQLIKYSSFRYSTMFDKYPRLCLTTAYDTIFPDISIKPHQSQQLLMNEIKKREAGLYLYNAAIGSGKTTTSVALGSYVKSIRGHTGLQLIFTCSVEPVREQVARMAYNQDIPFGIAVVDNGSVRIINNYKCKKDEERIIIIADIDATIALLGKSQNYILFVDEPTVGADQENHPVTKAIAKVIALAPKVTILCSATLPAPEEMPEIITYFKEKHSKSDVISVYSKESLIGCEMINFDGSSLCPHDNCQSCDELKIIVENLKKKSFIDRFYTAPIVYRLNERLKSNGLDGIDLENYFDQANKLSQTSIQSVAITMLEQLIATNNDILVKKICVPFGKVIIEEETENNKETVDKKSQDEQDDTGFMWATDETTEPVQEQLDKYNFEEIFTKQAHRYLGGCLVVVTNPMEFAYKYSRELFQNCEPASKIISQYKTLLDRFNLSLKKMDNMKNDDGKNINSEEKDKMKQNIMETGKPEIKFYPSLQVNSPHHLMKFAPQMKDKINRRLLRHHYILEEIPLDAVIPDWVMQLLFAGVGIYSPGSSQLDKLYTEFVIKMTTEGNLAFLISDDSICYGANYPFAHVIIEEEMAHKHSIGTIFQLAGRAGRVGQSWVAYAHIGLETNKRIMDYIKGNQQSLMDEAVNIRKAFTSVIDELKALEEAKQVQKQLNDKKIIKLSEVVPIEKNKEESIKHDHKHHEHKHHENKHHEHKQHHEHGDQRSHQRYENKYHHNQRHTHHDNKNQNLTVQPAQTGRYVPPHLRPNYKQRTQTDEKPKQNDDGWKTVTRKH